MRSRDAIDAPEALVLTMVLVSAADGGMTDREIGVMSLWCKPCRRSRISLVTHSPT